MLSEFPPLCKIKRDLIFTTLVKFHPNLYPCGDTPPHPSLLNLADVALCAFLSILHLPPKNLTASCKQ